MARVKGIHPLERHAEKIVLGVVLLVVVVALVLQFLPGRNDIEVAAGRRVPPQEVFVALAEDAKRLQARIQDPAPQLPEIGEVDLADSFLASIERPVLQGVQIAAVPWGEAPGISVDGSGVLPDSFQPFVPPAPAVAAAYSHWITVDPFFAAAHPELAERFGAGQPYDLAGVTAAATFDGTALERVLRGAEGGRGVPAQWWRNNLAVLEVRAERRRLLPDDSWSEPEPVATWLPTRFDPLASVEGAPTPEQMPQIVQAATQLASAVLSPAYLPQISGLPWLPPEQWKARAAAMDRIGVARQIERRIATLEGELERLQRREQNPGEGERGDGGRSGTRSGGPGGAGPRPAAPAGGQSGRGDESNRTQERIERLRADIEAERAKLREIGLEGGIAVFLDPAREWAPPVDPDVAVTPTAGRGSGGAAVNSGGGQGTSSSRGRPGAGDSSSGAAGGTSAGPSGVPVALLGNPSVPVWIHDTSAEPGATYAYRLRLVMNNPYFGRGQNLGNDPDQQALAASPTVESEWSEWSEPVEVGAARYFFVTGASDGEDGLGRNIPNATAELYEMYYGFYRRSAARAEAGEPVSGRAELPGTLVLVDPGETSPAAFNTLLEQRNASASGSPSGGAADGGSGGGSRITRGTPGGESVQPSAPRPNEAKAEITLPAGLEAVPKSREVGGDVILLDVASLPAAGQNQLGTRAAAIYQAVFRGADGSLLLRSPNTDAQSAQRQMASFLADLGELGALLPSSVSEASTAGAATPPNPGRTR